ncbi:hypothetical protein MUK42_07170 [Musa troglodytarum]|uniref:Uncharacterized protein n=1 Tax=Musa troglodytarum TaxID=320322 RepID=A0A9E7HYE5_9LILI|nr:hypothetical protein MUK42_07170 [Musa troglodytarum]
MVGSCFPPTVVLILMSRSHGHKPTEGYLSPHHVKQRSGRCMLGEVSHHGLPVHCFAHSVSLSAHMWPTPAGVASAKAAPSALYPTNSAQGLMRVLVSAPNLRSGPFWPSLQGALTPHGANLATRFLPLDPVRS